jgi:hypothetical protein
MEDEMAGYLDDILASDFTKEENIIRAVTVINKLTFYKIIINQKKSYFACQTMPTLGYVVDGTGIHLHPSKIEGIINLSFPRSSTQMKSFLGMCNFARNSLKNYAEKVAPLDAVSLQKTIVPTPRLLQAFADAKQAVVNAATLVTEDHTKELILSTDASLTGLGFTLGQVKEEFKNLPTATLTEKQIDVIRYGSVAVKSHTLTHASPTMRELAGVIFAIKKCYTQLQGRKFTIMTDHSALVYLFNACTTDHKLQRWADILMSLDFEVVHIRGVDNTRPDALPNRSIARTDCTG